MSSHSSQLVDLDSPGYEFLRSYVAMSNLYTKLIALDYQKEFCYLYKCPPIHKYYFALENSNRMEQQFCFMCLCVWLIKNKCQMNFDIDPRDYQDIDSTVNVIFEALKLLLGSNEDQREDDKSPFPAGRLKKGYGPEAIYCLNKFADRALELALEENPKIGQVEINYQNKQKVGHEQARPSSSIIIGQPIVGGGLTTRPLGNYQIDDSSLVFDYNPDIENNKSESQEQSEPVDEWQSDKLDRIAPLFEIGYDNENPSRESLADLLDVMRKTHDEVSSLMSKSKPALQMICQRIERQMQLIASREKSLNASLGDRIASTSSVWREYCEQSKRHTELLDKINHKTDLFENYVKQLKEIRNQEGKLNDESKLRELGLLTDKLNRETQEMDLKLGVLLAATCLESTTSGQ